MFPGWIGGFGGRLPFFRRNVHFSGVLYIPLPGMYIPSPTMYIPSGRMYIPSPTLYIPSGRMYILPPTMYIPLPGMCIPSPTMYIPLPGMYIPSKTMYNSPEYRAMSRKKGAILPKDGRHPARFASYMGARRTKMQGCMSSVAANTRFLAG